MNAWQKCSDLRDAVPLYKPRGLYLKPVAKLHISVYLPQLKAQAKSVSYAEIVEKLKQRIKPEKFTSIKVSKSTLQFIRFDGEIESKCKLQLILAYLDNKTVKVSEFSDALKIRAVEAKPDFPSKYDWDSFFRDAKDMNEMKVGERPDTIYLANLPCEWFTYESIREKPSEKLVGKIFEQFGEVSRIDIPLLDPFRHQMNTNISGIKQFTFNQNVIFEAYVQFKEYFCFVKAMDAFRGMKLVYMDEKKDAFMASIKVDFDKSKHLSDASIRRRQIVRERLEKKEKETLEKKMKEKEAEEKRKEAERQEQLERRKRREEKRKQRQIEKLKLKEVDHINEKIAVEEYLLVIAQRKLESIRLLGELINRVKNEKERELSSDSKNKKKRKHDDKIKDENSASKKAKSLESQVDTEKDLRYKLIQKFKKMQERQIAKETTKQKSLVSEISQLSKNASNTSSVSSDTISDNEYHDSKTDDRFRLHENNNSHYHNTSGNRRMSRRFNRNGRGRNDSNFNKPSDEFQNSRGRFPRNRRTFGRPSYQNSWRGTYNGQYLMPFMDPMLLTYSHEYYKYLQKIARDSKRSTRRSSSRSYSRSRSRSYSRSRSRSYSKSYSRSYSRSRSRSRRSYRSCSRSRSKEHSRYSRSVGKHVEKVNPAEPIESVVDTVAEAKHVKDKLSNSIKKHKKERKKHKKKKKSKTDDKKNEPNS